MEELSGLRKRIDALDDRILEALNERAKVVQKVYEVKVREAKGGKVQAFVPSREASILRRLAGKNAGPFPGEGIAPVFREVISACRSLEQLPRVAYFGAPWSNTHEAALNCFGSRAEFNSGAGIPGVFEDVERNRADYGVVPVENSTEGAIVHTLDVLAGTDLKVCAEISLPIRNLLLGRRTLKEIRTVVSHPQPLAQCRVWLARHLPGVKLLAVDSTPLAAQRAAKDRSGAVAAIASELAARKYGAPVLVRDIQDRGDNATRFFVVGRTLARPSGKDKTSVVVSVRDKVGALAGLLKPFERHRVNLTSIESRPSKKRAWEYYFFVDFHGHQDDPRIQRLLKDLARSSAHLKVLGSYPAA
jgi:chorismate mutase/prephenate dehydratase